MKQILSLEAGLKKLWVRRSALALLAPVVLGGAALAAPKINVDDRPIDRQARDASFAPIIKKVSPSVVNIYSTKKIQVRPFFHPFFDDPFLRRFFGGGDEESQPSRPQLHKALDLGSGVIVSKDGYILTNNHVVEDADKVEVALADGKKEYTAKVVGTDPETDVAVLKVDASDLPAITLADSDKLEVGDVVLAIGNPFGVGQSVTKGIVSGLGRGDFPGGGVVDYADFIQTDAAINPGNSGGALIDAEGRLVGINTFIMSRNGRSQGVGFAIPVNLARSVMDRLVSDGKVTRGYLGVNIQPVTSDLAKEFNLPDETGALVGGVSANTPAEQAGIKEGDVITEFNGKKVNDFRHLRFMVAQTPPKTKVTLKVLRDGREKTLTATLGELTPEVLAKAGGPAEKEELTADALEGVEVSDLDSQARRQYDIPASVRGALVTKVDSDSDSYEAGLRPGNVILEINRQPVRNADDAVTLSRQVKGNRVLLRVWSRGGSHFIVVDVSKNKK
jgi:serine protease Do